MSENRKLHIQYPADVVLDTDAYNEIDDQFAISYLLRSTDKLNTKALYAAPFFNPNSTSPADGMERSYQEILHLLKLSGDEQMAEHVFRGSQGYLPDEKTPVDSAAARDLAERAMGYSPEKPLYVVAIGAITNVASAILMNPKAAENMVIVWLAGHDRSWENTREFNMIQDVAASRVVMTSAAKLVQLPCMGVVSAFTISKPELQYWLVDKAPLADYLARHCIEAADSYAFGKVWTRPIWDVTAVAWLLNDEGQFMIEEPRPICLPGYDGKYEPELPGTELIWVRHIYRDRLMRDLFEKILQK